MWLQLTADIGEGKTDRVIYNTDNIVSMLVRGTGTLIFALDGTSYPVVESLDQIDAAMAEFTKRYRPSDQ